MVLAHRFAFERKFGPLAPETHLHHVCGNGLCVRIDHLRSHQGADVALVTDRQLEVLKFWVNAGMGYGATQRAAELLGITSQATADHLYHLRRRLRVRTTRDAVDLLDAMLPDWRTGMIAAAAGGGVGVHVSGR